MELMLPPWASFVGVVLATVLFLKAVLGRSRRVYNLPPGPKPWPKYLDKDAGGSVTTPEEFKWMLDELFLLNGVLNIGDSIPWLDWLDLQGYIKRMKKLGKMFDRFLEHVVDEHNERRRREGESFVAKDMVDVLLQFADNPNLEVKLKREGVKAFTQDLIAGGTESSAVTVEWALSELLKKPEVFAKATEELDRVVGRGRWVTEKDVPSLTYVDAIVKETMRLHPVAPMLVPRLSREDTSVDGYDIPAGTRVLVSVWTIGRDPKLLDAPEEFMPEKVIGNKIDVKGQDFELLPFGSGRRMCPGLQPWAEGDPAEPRQSAARLRVEAARRRDEGAAEHGGDLRLVDAAQVPA
ncbi:hypothetical protein OsJ_26206 [Oryza sativa Japonica Group]|uniref:Uncharacterized protein n=1 Tax=Oryza sativa subsp. japonica TaxID=39947 RepID=A3BQ30_ORYSJ|nr:hypothetical protein OsJ_26206 [Oryza sativa Japonica Group]